MNNRILTYILTGAAMIAISCERENFGSGEKGYLTAAIEQDNTVNIISTKSDETTSDTPFSLNIYKGDELLQSISDHRTLADEPLVLNCATYKVTAQNRDTVAATFDGPRYYGETQIKILADVVNNVDITCSLADVLVAPTFTDDFNSNFTAWSLSVSNGKGSLEWAKDGETLGKTGYFYATGTLTWTLTLTNKAGRTFKRTETISDAVAKQQYAMNFKVKIVDENTGASGIRIVLDDETSEREYDLTLDFTSSEAEAKSVNAWALFADITGEFKNAAVPDGLKLQYKKLSDDSWVDFDGTISTDAENKSFTARLTGLEPSTEYVVRAVTTKENGKKQISFTTEAAAEVHNMSFDSWYMSGKAPMPNASGYSVWDSANKATASLGTIPTKQETSHVAVTGDGKSAARLESCTAFGFLAAGNIYTGSFVKVIGMSGASLNWGTPFTSRPLAMKGYFDYSPKAIDKTDSDHSSLAGETDICQIQVFLTDRTDMYNINTSEGKFVDVNGSDVIAYGKLESNVTTSTKSDLVNGYEQFTIKLEYRDLTRKPAQVVIVGAASKYGDYFTGGIGSVLYLDEFSFVYDPAELD